MSRPSQIDPSLYFHQQSVTQPTSLRTNNSHIKLIFDHEDPTCKRVLHFLRDNGVEPDVIHYRFSPLSRRELTGLLKALPLKDLELFVKLGSRRYRTRPFTISQEYHEQTINHILPHQSELLGVPIVYNTLTNTATIVPPMIDTISMGNLNGDFGNPFGIDTTPKTQNYLEKEDYNKQPQQHFDPNNPTPPPKKNKQKKSKGDISDVLSTNTIALQKVLGIVSSNVGQNSLWDNGGDLFPVPRHLEQTRNPQRDWEIQRWNSEQEAEAKQKEALELKQKRKSMTPREKEAEIENMVEEEKQKMLKMFASLDSSQSQSRFDPNYDPRKERRGGGGPTNGAFSSQTQHIEQYGGIKYDPKTGKPTPQSLRYLHNSPNGQDNDDFSLNEDGDFSFSGQNLRIALPETNERGKENFASQKSLARETLINDAMMSQAQWRRQQELKFGKQDNNEFEKWKRERAQRKRMEMGIK